MANRLYRYWLTLTAILVLAAVQLAVQDWYSRGGYEGAVEWAVNVYRSTVASR